MTDTSWISNFIDYYRLLFENVFEKFALKIIMYHFQELKPIFSRLADISLLASCGRGLTQNSNESLHSLELCPEGTVQLSQRSTTRYRPGRADLQRWPRRRTATSDTCCQSAAILWSVHQGPTGSRPEAAHQLNETKCRGSEGKAEEGTERTSRSAICLQDRRGHPLQQWPVSRHFRCDASCSTVPDLWSAKEGPPPRVRP